MQQYLVVILCGVIFVWVASRWRNLRAGDRTGDRTIDGDAPCSYSVNRTSRKDVGSVEIAIPMPDRFRFLIRPEGMLDRFSKQSGLARAWQSNDAAFDVANFVVSEDEVLRTALSTDRPLRDAIVALLQGPLVQQVGRRQLGCSAQFLWVTLDYPVISRDLDDVAVARALAAQVVPSLQTIRKHLEADSHDTWTHRRDPAQRNRWLISAVVLAIGCAGGLAGVADLLAAPGVQVGVQTLQSHALQFTAPVAVLLAAMVYLLVGRGTRTLGVLLDVVCIGIPGAWLLGYFGLIAVNQRLDTGAAMPVPVRVTDLRVQPTRRSTQYLVTVQGFAQVPAAQTLRVPQVFYSGMEIGSCVTVNWHPGRLGEIWRSTLRETPGACGPASQ